MTPLVSQQRRAWQIGRADNATATHEKGNWVIMNEVCSVEGGRVGSKWPKSLSPDAHWQVGDRKEVVVVHYSFDDEARLVVGCETRVVIHRATCDGRAVVQREAPRKNERTEDVVKIE